MITTLYYVIERKLTEQTMEQNKEDKQMAVTNQRTVTIKMTRGQALRLARLITSHVAGLEQEYAHLAQAAEFKIIHDKIRAGVDALDQKEG